MRNHVFVAGQHSTWSGTRICADCGFPEWSKLHEIPERTEEEQELSARIVGEAEAGRGFAGHG